MDWFKCETQKMHDILQLELPIKTFCTTSWSSVALNCHCGLMPRPVHAGHAKLVYQLAYDYDQIKHKHLPEKINAVSHITNFWIFSAPASARKAKQLPVGHELAQ